MLLEKTVLENRIKGQTHEDEHGGSNQGRALTCGWLGKSWLGKGGCPVHCRIFKSISGFYLLEAGSLPLPVVMAKNVSRHC